MRAGGAAQADRAAEVSLLGGPPPDSTPADTITYLVDLLRID